MTVFHGLPRRSFVLGAAGAVIAGMSCARGAEAARGITDNSITIGTATDLSGVTVSLGSNNANAVRLAFDEANSRGGVHGRKITYIVEDNQYQVPKAVQGMNKLLNRDDIFFALVNSGTPMNEAIMPAMFEKSAPNIFPLTSARSMYEPFNRFKFGQFASYYDQMRAGVKYFVEKQGKKSIGAMTFDTDYGKEVLVGTVAQLEVMGMKMAGQSTHTPTEVNFNGSMTKLREQGCDLIVLATAVKDTIIIVQTARKMGWDVAFLGNLATYSTAIAEAPGAPAEGFYSMSPGLYAYPDDPRPPIRDFFTKFKKAYGIDPNYFGEAGYTAATFVLTALEKAGRDLNLETFLTAMESMKDWQDIFGSPPLSLSPTNHHASSQSFLSIIKDSRWVPVVQEPLGY
jgi:branched-chain amino acid transport system substrate-binding protein